MTDKPTLINVLNSLIPTNTTNEVSAFDIRVVLEEIANSNFNAEDEIRSSLSYQYTRTTPSNWNGTFSEVNSALDELALRMKNYEINGGILKVAYVSSTYGNNSTAEIGNENKPFSTIQAAINDSSIPNIIRVLSGVYNENITVKSDCVLDMQNSLLNGKIDTVNNVTNCHLLLYGTTINYTMPIGVDHCVIKSNGSVNVFGGTINSYTNANNVHARGFGNFSSVKSNIFETRFNIFANNSISNKRGNLLGNTVCYNVIFNGINCENISILADYSGAKTILYNCKLINNNYANIAIEEQTDNVLNMVMCYCCDFFNGIAHNIVGSDVASRYQNSYFENCRFTSNISNIKFKQTVRKFTLKNCLLKSDTSCLEFDNAFVREAGVHHLINNNIFDCPNTTVLCTLNNPNDLGSSRYYGNFSKNSIVFDTNHVNYSLNIVDSNLTTNNI